jgi:hypothetical protein
MTLVIEDGTGVPGANSYNTLVELRAYATARGVTLGTDTEVEVQSTFAIDYLEGLRAQYQGAKTLAANALQWPRKDVLVDCVAIDDDFIPIEIKSAQSQLVLEQFQGVCLTPTITEAFVTKDKVDVLETEYSDKFRTNGQPRIRSVDVLLAPLFNACGQGFALTALRI